MGLIDKYIKETIKLASGIKEEDIFNIYQIKGALPQKLTVDDKNKKILKPYVQQDMFVVFGIEEGGKGNETGVITEDYGAPEDTLIILHRYTVKILFNGDDADFYSLKFKARLYSKIVQNYLESNNITVITQNPEISFETEEVAGEFWSRRGIKFDVEIELHFEDKEENIDVESLGYVSTRY